MISRVIVFSYANPTNLIGINLIRIRLIIINQVEFYLKEEEWKE